MVRDKPGEVPGLGHKALLNHVYLSSSPPTDWVTKVSSLIKSKNL